jgi:hypothetical protein
MSSTRAGASLFERLVAMSSGATYVHGLVPVVGVLLLGECVNQLYWSLYLVGVVILTLRVAMIASNLRRGSR